MSTRPASTIQAQAEATVTQSKYVNKVLNVHRKHNLEGGGETGEGGGEGKGRTLTCPDPRNWLFPVLAFHYRSLSIRPDFPKSIYQSTMESILQSEALTVSTNTRDT